PRLGHRKWGLTSGTSGRAEALAQTAAFERERRRTFCPQLGEELIVLGELPGPRRKIDLHHLRESVLGKVEPRPIEVAVAGLQTKRRGRRMPAAPATLDDPLQHAHVLAEAR